MSLTLIRAEIKTILEGVTGIGIVHNYERLSIDATKFLTLFKDTKTGKINGCMFRREKFTRQHGMGGRVAIAHVFVLRRFTGLQDADATDISFDDVNELIADAFDTEAAEDLNGKCDTIHPDFGPMSGAAGIQLDISEPRMFGNVLCHYAEMRLCAVEIIN